MMCAKVVATCARYWLVNDADLMGCPRSHVPWSSSGLPVKLLDGCLEECFVINR
jgi:hypothetical protein